ncbi:hypothetical protein CLU79DRAFT_227820 [Phycomyces nitens]|nr:hypothetical protein CLU79DRAFT_227820 [Phycomyces nitens]
MGNIGSKKSSKKSESSITAESTPSHSDVLGTSSIPSNPSYQTYYFSESDSEGVRLHGQHYLLKNVFQRDIFAPVEARLLTKDTHVLDIGCGDRATWLRDVSVDYPLATFHGFDILPFVPNDESNINNVPSNCIITQYDITQGIPFPDNTFDYVHQRLMSGVYCGNQMDESFKEIMRVTKPGGWIELVESATGAHKTGPLFKVLSEQKILCGPILKKKLENLGCVDIRSDYKSMPICWGGAIGKATYETMEHVLRYMGPLIWNDLGYDCEFDPDLYNDYIDRGFDECAKSQAFINVYWAFGRKPIVQP